MRCDASSDDRATALPVIYLVLISTYQVSSAWLECRALKGRKKRFVPRPGIEPGTFHLPGGCSTTKLPRPCTFCAVLSILYFFYNHPWMRRLHCRNARVLNEGKVCCPGRDLNPGLQIAGLLCSPLHHRSTCPSERCTNCTSHP